MFTFIYNLKKYYIIFVLFTQKVQVSYNDHPYINQVLHAPEA